MFQEMAFIKKLIFLVMALFFCLFTGLSYAAAPQAVSLSPSSGTIRANKALNLTTVYTDADGRGNLHYAMFLINRSVDGKDCFYGYYLVKENKLYLRNDANTAWVGGFAPGSANIIQNSYVSLNCAKTRISGTGIKLAIRWNVTFKNTFIGLKNCYLYAKDKSGNRTEWAKKGTWRIGTNTAPKVGTITPDSGSAQPDTRVYFTTTFSDVDGYNDLQYGALLINTSANGAKCFYAYYLPGTNKLYLRNDANTAWLGGFAPKSNKAIRNSYAKLDCSKTTVSYSGTTLTIRWCVVFRSTFKGSKNCYLYAKDTAGARTAWEKKGTWTIGKNASPKINAVTPADKSSFLAGARVDIKIEATDADNDPLEYQFSVGGAVKQLWSKLDTYSWQTFASDTGAVSVTCEVKDDKGSQATKTISYQIINPTVEEVLEKVADNYKLIIDKKMDVVMSSQFNNEAFGSTVYTRHYFKKPEKQRTETFPDSRMIEGAQNEIQVLVGPDLYLVDPVSKAQSHSNMLTELNLTLEQLNQMDELYHLSDFLAAHTISRIDDIDGFSKGLVILEVVPNTENKLYSKLNLTIDYFKGLKVKSSTYLKEGSQDNLKQEVEITGSKIMANGAWLPISQVKVLYLTEGILIMTSNFENIQLNTGLSGDLFDPQID